jgi:hypothetical protein
MCRVGYVLLSGCACVGYTWVYECVSELAGGFTGEDERTLIHTHTHPPMIAIFSNFYDLNLKIRGLWSSTLSHK